MELVTVEEKDGADSSVCVRLDDSNTVTAMQSDQFHLHARAHNLKGMVI